MASPYATFAAGVLKGIGAPVTPQNIAGFVGWSQAEGPLASSNWQRNNPLNTTLSAGSTGANFNSAGVKTYPTVQAGITATVKTLTNGYYGGIVQAFKSNNPKALGPAIGASPWGTSGGLASQTIAAALAKNWGTPGATGAPSSLGATGSSGGPTSVKLPGYSLEHTVQNFDQAGFDKANRMAIAGNYLRQSSASNPFDIGPKIPGMSSSSSSLASLFPTAAPNPQDYMSATQVLQKIAGQSVTLTPHPAASGTAPTPTGAGDLSPLSHPGWTLTELDQGVDASAAAGTPILAMNTSKVVNIDPNFWAGQPMVQMQLLDGPNKGKYWYVSEQVTGIPKVGQVIPRGGVVARYASSGTGIEIGWGSGRQGLTLTATADPSAVATRHAIGTPQGRDFLHRILHASSTLGGS